MRSLVVAVLLAAGCGTSHAPLTASVAQFQIQPLPTLVARKVELPLYLVVSKDDVVDDMHADGFTVFIFTVPPLDLKNVRTFATRDVKQALSPYFSSVNVVWDEAQLPKTPHVRAQLKIARLEYEHKVKTGHNGGQSHEVYGALEWTFALRAASDADWTFRFAERTVSDKMMTSFDDTSYWQDTFQLALRHLLAEYDRSGTQAKLLALAAPDAYAN